MAMGTLCGWQRSCLICLFCGCVLNSVHLINVTFTFDHYNEVVMFVMHAIRFSRRSVCVPLLGRSSGDAAPPLYLVSELVSPPLLSALRRSLSRPAEQGLAKVWLAPRRSTHRMKKSDVNCRSPTKGVQRTVCASHWTTLVMQEDGDHLRWWRGRWSPNVVVRFTTSMTQLRERQLQWDNAVMAANADYLKQWTRPVMAGHLVWGFWRVWWIHWTIAIAPLHQSDLEAFGKPRHTWVCNRVQKTGKRRLH